MICRRDYVDFVTSTGHRLQNLIIRCKEVRVIK